mmetsp:Transcript_20454/g.41925  ORF Transcript_20454/g.41925 Transcript_20454/m.41925 type:complete len:421 (+) Transcript_20454:302-1564(+)
MPSPSPHLIFLLAPRPPHIPQFHKLPASTAASSHEIQFLFLLVHIQIIREQSPPFVVASIPMIGTARRGIRVGLCLLSVGISPIGGELLEATFGRVSELRQPIKNVRALIPRHTSAPGASSFPGVRRPPRPLPARIPKPHVTPPGQMRKLGIVPQLLLEQFVLEHSRQLFVRQRRSIGRRRRRCGIRTRRGRGGIFPPRDAEEIVREEGGRSSPFLCRGIRRRRRKGIGRRNPRAGSAIRRARRGSRPRLFREGGTPLARKGGASRRSAAEHVAEGFSQSRSSSAASSGRIGGSSGGVRGMRTPRGIRGGGPALMLMLMLMLLLLLFFRGQLPGQFFVGVEDASSIGRFAASAVVAAAHPLGRQIFQLLQHFLWRKIDVREHGFDGVFHVSPMVAEEGVELLGGVPREHGLEGFERFFVG